MSSFFNRVPPLPEKPVSKHPWESRMKPQNLATMKYAHNSTTSNLKYPKKTKSKPDDKKKDQLEKNQPKDVFTVIGIKFSKEFIYCRHWVKTLHSYRLKRFNEPVITGVTTVEWPKVWNDLKLQHSTAHCIDSPVVVLLNGVYLGGHKELKEYLEDKYTFHFNLDYHKEGIKEFSNLLNSTSRPFVYMHFSVDNKTFGTMIFMLYTDIVPITCENFIRLCCETRGGYAGTPVHRIVKDCWIQCGGFGLKNTDMRCENFILDFDKRGVLGMANADRHIDCSTQFFIISQPAHWMKDRYVAFGQLIDGESTFKAIEESPTWYESPTQDIKICKAGVLNLECVYPVSINKNAQEYVHSHIENLYEVGEYFYELVMENVSNTILLNYLKTLENAVGEEQFEGDEGKVRPVHRFVHNKSYTTVDGEENNDFAVDSYVYEPEEYNYDHVSPTPSPVIKPNIPFYMALTDVPYPGEVDSNYDLKRFLQGKYCLESDLTRDVSKIFLRTSPRDDSFFMELQDPSSSEDSSLGSESQKELGNSLIKMGESVCVSGATIQKIARSLRTGNILKYFYTNKNASLNDEELRRARLLQADMVIRKQRRSSKLISIKVSEDHIDRRVKRRLTGFLREEDIAKIIKARVKAGIEVPEDDSSEDSDICLNAPVRKNKTTKVKYETPMSPKHTSGKKNHHESVLHRLYSDVSMEQGEKPTLKDYRAIATSESERDHIRPSLFLTASERIQMSDDSVDINKSLKQEYYHQSKHKRMMEAVAVEVRDTQVAERSIRSYQFAKTRPSLTVKQYLQKNAADGTTSVEVKFDYAGRKGQRLPGDSSLYSNITLVSDDIRNY